MLNLKTGTVAVLAAALLLFSTACSPLAKHPNQFNTFDGATYDSLTAAHAALTSLRDTVSNTYPQYKGTFNQAVAAYELAYDTYISFRTAPANQSQTALAIDNLTVSIVNLENSFQADMHVQSSVAQVVRERTFQLRASHPSLNISDILTELQIAASIAATVPAAQPYAALAEIVISATRSALDAITSASGQPIDLSTITPVAPIA